MSNLHKSTDRYKNENEYILSLNRVIFRARKPRICKPDSILWLTYVKFCSLLAIKSYFIELWNGWKFLLHTFRLGGRKTRLDALVIGNGPSQGFLTTHLLMKFRASGGEIFAVNFWTENKYLSEVHPDYIVISDDDTLSTNSPPHLLDKNKKLFEYLIKNKDIKIICPIKRCKDISASLGGDRVIGFVDSELRMWIKNINPLLPRGYLSMTLYKALALSIWFGYAKIYIIGMDNTYPRSIYCDINNNLINHETHAGGEDFVIDQSELFINIGNMLNDCSKLFLDLYKFPAKTVINLDSYSLTDAFKKIRLSDWLR